MVKLQSNSTPTSAMEASIPTAETALERIPLHSGQTNTSSTAAGVLLSSLSQSTHSTKEFHINNAPSVMPQHSQCNGWQKMDLSEWLQWHNKYEAESNKQDKHKLKCLLLLNLPHLQSTTRLSSQEVGNNSTQLSMVKTTKELLSMTKPFLPSTHHLHTQHQTSCPSIELVFDAEF